MPGTFKPVKITDKIYWVGAIDWNIRDFHGYSTNRGTTYNAYLVLSDKITLIDTVKAPYESELLARVSELVDPREIDIIVSNHSEMDHSGSLPHIVQATEPETVYASTMGKKALAEHFKMDKEVVAVGDGDSADLGGLTLKFVETRMLHWPDSMFSYMPEQRMLFSSDAFGMHLASSERFDDTVKDDWHYEAAKYYANILMPYSPLIQKLFDKVNSLGIEIDIIAPDHGPIWRDDPGQIMGLYQKWSQLKPYSKAVVVYDTMWNSTAKMAQAVADGLIHSGHSVKLMSLKSCHRSDIMTELLSSGAIVIGSPTLNNNIYPTVADFLTYMRGLRPKYLIGAAFGSFGWSGEAVDQVEEMLRAIKIELAAESIKVKYVPNDEALQLCFTQGEAVGKRLHEILAADR